MSEVSKPVPQKWMGNKKWVGDYYPFGLTMAGISSKALAFGGPENKYKYNGIELGTELDLDIYEAFYRNLDPQTGRWWQIDPKTESMEMWSPYASNYDNPILYNDKLGDEGQACCQWLKDGLNWIADKGIEVGKYAFGFTVGTVVGVYDNATGSNVRGQLASSYEGQGSAAIGWNTGLNTGDMASIAIGAVEMTVGGGMTGGGTLATVGTGGVSAPVSAPVAATGVAVATHGVINAANGINNLGNQNGRVNATKAEQRAEKLSETPRPGKDFTKAGKEAVIDVNKQNNAGKTVCNGCGVTTTPAQQSQRGVTPSPSETHVDHIDPKSKGGSGTPNNGQVLCRGCNLKKSDN